MEILRRAPMLGVLAALVSGFALYDRLGVWAFALGVPVTFMAVTFCSYLHDFRGQRDIFIAAFVAAMLCSWRAYSVVSRPLPENFTIHNAAATVSSIRSWGRGYVAVLDIDDVGSYAVRLRFAELMPGTRISFRGVTQRFRPRRSDSDFDEARYWFGRGVSGWMSIYDVKELPVRSSLALMRYRLSRALTIYMPNLTSSYLKAAWLGERTDELNKRHIVWGTSHLLSVSGFHVGIVVLIAGFFFGYNFMLSIILWSYIFLTGAAPSALRAGLMIQLWMFARVIGRPSNGVNSVCSAAVMLLFWRPFLFWDIGFRLSVVSVLALASMADLRKTLWPLVSTIAFLVTFPQIAMTFKSVPLVGIIINLFAPLYFSFAFTIASVCAFLRLVGLPLMSYVMLAVEGMFVLFESAANICASIVPFIMGWNFLTAWLGTGTLIFLVCRYLKFSMNRSLIIMSCMGFLAFVMFA